MKVFDDTCKGEFSRQWIKETNVNQRWCPLATLCYSLEQELKKEENETCFFILKQRRHLTGEAKWGKKISGSFKKIYFFFFYSLLFYWLIDWFYFIFHKFSSCCNSMLLFSYLINLLAFKSWNKLVKTNSTCGQSLS